ncbi:MAG TPA: AAA family ATPase, partial [Candidatus Berkiella sp.]|nr:AAA family ATPase [Candidatus Berkiella sp.]
GTAQHGIPISDHTLIKPGALHKANGGYLMLEIKKLLNDIHAWNSLKRILLEQKIAIEPLQSQSGSNSTQLQPEPISLKTKVILLGDRYLYDELGQDDDDFN